MAARKKRSTTRRSASRSTPGKKRTTRRKKNYGYAAIPGAGATAGVIMANKPLIELALNEGITKLDTWKRLGERATRPQWLKKSIKNGAIGYAAGYAVKELVPNSGILGKGKKMIGGIAKKVKVF